MAITTDGMKLVGTQDWGSKLQSQYFLKCSDANHTQNTYCYSTERSSEDGVKMTKAVWDCGCTLVDKWETTQQKVSA